MVDKQIQDRGITDARVLAAMRTVPRHEFVPQSSRSRAYADYPLPIGEGQTISQPYIVALMTELMELSRSDVVLEIGTGSGYQAAILSQICREVFTVEIKEGLYKRTSRLLEKIGYQNISTRHGDGYFGWEEEAPFQAIMVTAAVDHIPPPLLAQLADGGRLVLPLGNPYGMSGQMLVVVKRRGQEFLVRQILAVRFVPLTGRALEQR
jgi:protein-L-isoaspartate(D-aspartate) O-methyltransferase